jgi:HEAT repeat protein
MTVYLTRSDLADLRNLFRDGDEEARLQAVRRFAVEPPEADDRADVLDLLIEIMGDESWQVRKEAVAAALSWTDTHLLADKLVTAMSEPDDIGRRNAVIEGVIKLGAICIDYVLRDLAKKPDYRKVLVDVLGTFGDKRVIPALGEALIDEDPNVRAAAMEQLASFTDEEVVPALRAALRSPDLLVVLAALDGLNRHRTKLLLSELVPLHEQSVLRPAVMTALGHTEDVEATPLLVEGLIDKARGAREAALVALYRLHKSLPRDKQHKVEQAAQGLDEMTVRSSLRALMEASPPVRQATAALLGWTGRRELLRPLLLALGDSDPGVAEAAGAALLGQGEETLLKLCEMVPTLDPRSRGNIYRFFHRHASALGEGTLRQAVAAVLLDGLADKNAPAALAATHALSMLGLAAQEPRLAELAAGGGPVGERAQSALSALRTRHAAAARS